MYILGLNLAHTVSSAAILADGILVFAIAEERLNRKKHFGGFLAMTIVFSASGRGQLGGDHIQDTSRLLQRSGL